MSAVPSFVTLNARGEVRVKCKRGRVSHVAFVLPGLQYGHLALTLALAPPPPGALAGRDGGQGSANLAAARVAWVRAAFGLKGGVA